MNIEILKTNTLERIRAGISVKRIKNPPSQLVVLSANQRRNQCLVKELSLCPKLKLPNPYLLATFEISNLGYFSQPEFIFVANQPEFIFVANQPEFIFVANQPEFIFVGSTKLI